MKTHKIAKIGDRKFVSLLDDELGLVWLLPGGTSPVRNKEGRIKVPGTIKYIKTSALDCYARKIGKYLKIETVVEVQQ